MIRRRKQEPIVRKPIRRKCTVCEKVRLINYTKSVMPQSTEAYVKGGKKKKRLDVNGAIHYHYCEECRNEVFA
jgi:uncharacterized protein YlaI|tara:strand:- start:352 stop:570 length:219 start_codon:yes stop_codon:yes gene_type:complete